MAKLSIIIPVYYNEKNLIPLYNDLQEKVIPKLEEYEIIMVDDGSKDKSWEVMNKIYTKYPNIKMVRLSRNFGSHAACLAGLSVCTGDCATIKAADLQEPSELLLEMFESWKKGNKVVLAVRADREESALQKFSSNSYYWMMRKFVIKSMPKGGFDCYLLDRKVIEVLKSLDETNSALTLQILWSGFKRDFVYYVRKKREIGESKWTMAKKIKLVIDSMVSFSFFPIRFISFLGFAFSVGAFIWGVVVLIAKMFGKIYAAGYTSLMIVILFSSGLIMLTLGILGEYIWRTLDAARNRPVYIVDEARLENSNNNY